MATLAAGAEGQARKEVTTNRQAAVCTPAEDVLSHGADQAVIARSASDPLVRRERPRNTMRASERGPVRSADPGRGDAPYWEGAVTKAPHQALPRPAAGHSYPRPFCPHCWSTDVDWEEATGRATLYTYSVVYRNDLPPWPDRLPYVAAIVDLEEGPRMMTNVEDSDPDEIWIGMALEVTFRDEPQHYSVPVFRPA